MFSKVTLSTYDTFGFVKQLSHTTWPGEFTRKDIVGTNVNDWGNAPAVLSTALFSEKEDAHVDDIQWSFNGFSATTRTISMKIIPGAVAVIASYMSRCWELTDTELLTIQCIADGFSIQQTSHQLHISDEGVRSAVHRVRSKTGAQSTPHAVAICCRAGVI